MRIPLLLAVFRVGCVQPEPGPDPCVAELAADNAALDAAYRDYLKMPNAPAKAERLEELFAQEEAMFERVRRCDFGEDRSAYAGWYRSRMKFPSDLRQDWLYLQDHGTLRPEVP